MEGEAVRLGAAAKWGVGGGAGVASPRAWGWGRKDGGRAKGAEVRLRRGTPGVCRVGG